MSINVLLYLIIIKIWLLYRSFLKNQADQDWIEKVLNSFADFSHPVFKCQESIQQIFYYLKNHLIILTQLWTVALQISISWKPPKTPHNSNDFPYQCWPYSVNSIFKYALTIVSTEFRKLRRGSFCLWSISWGQSFFNCFVYSLKLWTN